MVNAMLWMVSLGVSHLCRTVHQGGFVRRTSFRVLINIANFVKFLIVVALVQCFSWFRHGVMHPFCLESKFAASQRVIRTTVDSLKIPHHEHVSWVSASRDDQI